MSRTQSILKVLLELELLFLIKDISERTSPSLPTPSFLVQELGQALPRESRMELAQSALEDKEL